MKFAPLLFVAIASFAVCTEAATMATYRAKCKSAIDHRFKFEGLCTVGVAPDGDGTAMIFSVTAPDGDQTFQVKHYSKRRAGTVNGIPAKEVAVVTGWLHFETVEGLDLRFTLPPKDLAM